MRRKRICTATLCSVPLDVYVCDGGSGYFDFGSRDMEIGLDGPWEKAMSVLLHEAVEGAFAKMNMRYMAMGYWSSSDTCVFHFDHSEFSKAMQEVSVFMAQVVPAFSKAFDKAYERAQRKAAK